MTKENLFKFLYSLIALLLFSHLASAQKVLNTTGTYIRINDYNLSYSVGEMAITPFGTTDYFTQGVLQPVFALVPGKPLTTTALGRGVCLGENIEVSFSTSLTFNDEDRKSVV